MIKEEADQDLESIREWRINESERKAPDGSGAHYFSANEGT